MHINKQYYLYLNENSAIKSFYVSVKRYFCKSWNLTTLTSNKSLKISLQRYESTSTKNDKYLYHDIAMAGVGCNSSCDPDFS